MRGVVQGKAAPIHNKMRALFCWSANANLGKGGQRGNASGGRFHFAYTKQPIGQTTDVHHSSV